MGCGNCIRESGRLVLVHFMPSIVSIPIPSMDITSSFIEHYPLSEPDCTDFSGGKKRLLSEFEEDSSSYMMEFLSSLMAFEGNVEQNQGFFVGLNGGFESKREQSMPEFVDSNRDVTSFVQSRPTKRTRLDSDDATTTTSDELSSGAAHRRVWVKNRSKAWWEQVDNPLFPDSEFKKGFGMSKATFNLICQHLESVVTKKDTMLRSAIPVRQRIAVCIWRLSTGEALREVSKRFGLGISTCHKLILEVSTAINTVLMPKFLKWPDEQKKTEIMNHFESISGIPNVLGSIYTTHIPIIAPKINVSSYFNKQHTDRNKKPSYTVTVQGVFDPDGIFTDISIGWPGSMSEDQVLEKSSLYSGASKGLLNNSWIVGSSGHALRDWLLVPYTNHSLSWSHHAYNEKIEEVQMIAKDSFSKVKARWGCLQKRTEMKLQDLPLVIGACCVLHNICEMRNDELNLDTTLNLRLDEDETMIEESTVRSVISMRARDQISHNLLHRNHANAHSSFI